MRYAVIGQASETSGVQWQYIHLNVFLLKKAEVSLGFLTLVLYSEILLNYQKKK